MNRYNVPQLISGVVRRNTIHHISFSREFELEIIGDHFRAMNNNNLSLRDLH